MSPDGEEEAVTDEPPREERTLIQVLDLLFSDVKSLRSELARVAGGAVDAQQVMVLLTQIRGHLERSIKLHADLVTQQGTLHRQQLAALAAGQAQTASGLLEIIQHQLVERRESGAPDLVHSGVDWAWPYAVKLGAVVAVAVAGWGSALWELLRGWLW